MKLNILNNNKYIKIPRNKQLYKCSLMVTERLKDTRQSTVILGAFFTNSEDELREALQSGIIRGLAYDGLIPLQRVESIDFQDTLERAEIILDVN